MTNPIETVKPVLQAVREFEERFAESIREGKDMQLKLFVAMQNGAVKFVRLHSERNFELDDK